MGDLPLSVLRLRLDPAYVAQVRAAVLLRVFVHVELEARLHAELDRQLIGGSDSGQNLLGLFNG